MYLRVYIYISRYVRSLIAWHNIYITDMNRRCDVASAVQTWWSMAPSTRWWAGCWTASTRAFAPDAIVQRSCSPWTAWAALVRENAWLNFCGNDNSLNGLKCFDCSLLEALLTGVVHPGQLEAYYRQLADWSRVNASPFTLGAALVLPWCSMRSRCSRFASRRSVHASRLQRASVRLVSRAATRAAY